MLKSSSSLWHKINSILLCITLILSMINFTTLETKAVDTTVIDVTGLASGSEVSHDCSKYIETKYDTVQHWQQCSICGKVYGSKVNHSYSEYWSMGDSCAYNNKLIHSCSCGYSYKTDNTRPHKEPFMNQNNIYHILDCRYCLNRVGPEVKIERHYDSGGELGCTTGRSGTCSVCNTYINGSVHQCDNTYNTTSKQEWGTTCIGCGKQVTYNRNISVSYNGTHMYVSMDIPLANSVKEIIWTRPGYYNQNHGEIVNSAWSLNGNTLHFYYECITKDNLETELATQYAVTYMGTDGYIYIQWQTMYI